MTYHKSHCLNVNVHLMPPQSQQIKPRKGETGIIHIVKGGAVLDFILFYTKGS